jgi:hypothetical protein
VTTLPKVTAPQLRQLARMLEAHPELVAARDHGERVTLASLHGRGQATRQPRARAGRSTVQAADQVTDNAWAYAITPRGAKLLTAWIRQVQGWEVES